MAPRWRIQYYRSEDGTVPFQDFLVKLSTREARANCKAWIELLRQLGDTISGSQHLTHANELHEVYDDALRIFYICDGEVIVIFDGLLPGDGKARIESIYRKVEDYVSNG